MREPGNLERSYVTQINYRIYISSFICLVLDGYYFVRPCNQILVRRRRIGNRPLMSLLDFFKNILFAFLVHIHCIVVRFILLFTILLGEVLVIKVRDYVIHLIF